MRSGAAVTMVFLLAATAFADDVCRLERLREIQGLPYSARQALVTDVFPDDAANPVHALLSDSLVLHYRGAAREIAVAGDWTAWQPVDELHHVPGTDLWVTVMSLPDRTRLDYKLVVDGAWVLDPRNPLTMMSGFGPNSELRGTRYARPRWLDDRPDVSACRLDTLTIPAPTLGGDRTVVVAVPPGADATPRPFLLVHDGLEYLEIADLARYLARADDLELPICVCVPPGRRTEEYAGSLQGTFTDWVVDGLMPLIESRYGDVGLTGRPWGSLGASYGGRITLDLARRRPDLFDRLAPMSPSVDRIQHAGIEALDPASVWLYVNWGTWDIPALLPGCERFARMLEERGFEHRIDVLPQGHSWGLWRDTLDDAFRFLYGDRP